MLSIYESVHLHAGRRIQLGCPAGQVQQLLNDVRKKSKEKIKVPISMKSLVEKKGVDIAQIGKKIDGNIKNSGNYDAFHDYLITQSLQK